MSGSDLRSDPGHLAREALRTGTVAGLAMIPFAFAFRAAGLRVNEYGRKTLEMLVGEVPPPWHFAATFVQHMIISWVGAVPLLWVLPRIGSRRDRCIAGVAYGIGFYVVLNSLALPLWFGDATPWQLGLATIYPSLTIHVIYGFVIGWMARPARAV